MITRRILPLFAALALCAPAARAQEDKTNAEVVKAVRALLDARRPDEQDQLKAALLARTDVDWASFRKGLEEGPYYQKPLVTNYGERHSRKHHDLVFSGEDGKPRGFSYFLPKSYDAQSAIPVLFYLHHAPQDHVLDRSIDRAGVALFKFRKMCEDHGILFVAPYTSKGAEWWTPQGRRLVEWTLRQIRRLYRMDDDRVALMGALGGADAVWCLGQEMPGTWSCLIPMTGDPYEITAIVRPLFLGTLDRMDVLMGVPGSTKSTVGEKDLNRFLADLKPLFGQRMRITAAIWPTAQGDFHYLDEVTDQIASFVVSRKRKPYADEVDVEVEAGDGLRSLWLRNDGWFKEGVEAGPQHHFKSTHLKWTAPERKEGDKKLGVQLDARPHWPVGMAITGTPGEAKNAQIFPGDVLLEADGVPVKTVDDLKGVLEKREWKQEVHLLIAREVKVSRLEIHDRAEERYKRYRAKIEELRRENKPIPANLWAEMGDAVEEEEPEEEEDAGDDDEIIIGGDEEEAGEDEKPGGKGGGRKPKAEKTEIRILERWVELRRPAPDNLVRADFGLAWDRGHEKEGVRVGGVFAGSLADRSGFKEGDVIVQVGDTAVKNANDIEDYFAETKFKFEADPEAWVDFTVRRQNPDGTWQEDRTVTVRWKPVQSSRVDARWDKRENTLYVLANHASGFTLYLTDDLIKPGQEFHLFINDVPYLDLIDPENAPEYPKVGDHADATLEDELYRMRRKRAKVAGWNPDVPWALEEFLLHRDRRQVYGAKMSFDLTKMQAGFEKAKQRHAGHRGEKGAKIKEAYDRHKGNAKG